MRETFSDYIVFIGGSSSFDLSPAPYNKYYALNKYCAANGISHEQTVYVGDDYGEGGNDESVYRSDFALSPLTIIEIFHNAWGIFCELLCKYRNVKSKLYAERYWHHLIIWRKDLINDAT